jgi:membrane peptidoglycan carboxypeptidase
MTLGVGAAIGVTIAAEATADTSSLRPNGDILSRRTRNVSNRPPAVTRLIRRRARRPDVSGRANPDAATPRPRRARWRLLRVGAVALALIVALFAAGAIYLASLPSVGDAQQRAYRILALHHGRYAGPQPAARLGDAVVAVEDEHFYANFLINILDGAGRAGLATLDDGQDPGGSTIAQQLARQLYGRGSGVTATLRDIGLGVKLSLAYAKPQILDMYLNAVYYGHGYWGDTAAARGYFDTTPTALSWSQAAMLAGLLVAPTTYDPFAHYALAKQRQRHVLDQLVVNHDLTASQARAAYVEPLGLR